MTPRYILLTFFFGSLIVKASGQDLLNIKGTIHKKSSPDRVAEVVVSNLRTKAIMTADDLGDFHISAAPGDTLLFKKAEYAPQIFVVTSPNDIIIYLQPAVLLKEVNIHEETKKQEVADMMNLYRKTGSYYTLTPSAWSVLNSPLTGFYELFGREPNRARQFQKHTQEEMEHIEVRKRYSDALIKKITGLSDDKEVQGFTDMFTPSYEDIKTWNDYELINYIKRSYEYYKNNKNRPKLPKLY
jgi:hypothetical protein